MKNIYKAIDDAYSALDECISKIVRSRLHKDKESEERALYQLEIETNGVLQNLSYIKRQLQKKDWIKVKDRLPEVDEYVLCVTKKGKYIITATYIPKDCTGKILGPKKWHGSGRVVDKITHWMPIIPPKED